jgi:DNA-binding NarL/FixJ family response regulator
MAEGSRVRVAAVNDYELVVEGLAKLLGQFPDRIEVADRIVVGEPIAGTRVDVALYDTYGRVGVAAPVLRRLAAEPGIDTVAIFSLDLDVRLIADARAAGARAFISKALPAAAIVDAVVAAAAGPGEVMALPEGAAPVAGAVDHRVPDALDWPGREMGLTERESQVLVLVAEGLTNRQAAEALYLSPETVKSYLRDAYAKIGVANRAAAATYVHRADAFRQYAGGTPLVVGGATADDPGTPGGVDADGTDGGAGADPPA